MYRPTEPLSSKNVGSEMRSCSHFCEISRSRGEMALRGLPFSKSMYVFRTEKHNTEVIHSSHKHEVKNKKETNVCTRIFKNLCIDVTQKDFYPKSHASYTLIMVCINHSRRAHF